jgi:hypothetical protein
MKPDSNCSQTGKAAEDQAFSQAPLCALGILFLVWAALRQARRALRAWGKFDQDLLAPLRNR